MDIKYAYSSKTKAQEAVLEIKNGLNADAKLIIFFASSNYNPTDLAVAFQASFPNVAAIGCTTAGEIISGKMLKNSLVAMSIDSNVIEDLAIETVVDLRQRESIAASVKNIEKHFNQPINDLDKKQFIGMMMIDGLSGAEEIVMEKLGIISDLLFIGGSAGDDLKFMQTHVFAEGKAYTNAAVIAVLKTVNGFEIIKTQSFKATTAMLNATKVDEATRSVLEFNYKPALDEYAHQLHIPKEEVANHFMSHPVGLLVDDADIFVRSPQQVVDNTIKFYCSMKPGMQLSILESTDIIADTRTAIEKKSQASGPFKGIINFHCILRTLELEQKGLSDDYGSIFSNIPTIGFSTYGEQFLGHINQTSTLLAFK